MAFQHHAAPSSSFPNCFRKALAACHRNGMLMVSHREADCRASVMVSTCRGSTTFEARSLGQGRKIFIWFPETQGFIWFKCLFQNTKLYHLQK